MTTTFSAYEHQCSSIHIHRVRSLLSPRKSLISSINSQIHQPRTVMMEEGTDKDIYMLKPKKTLCSGMSIASYMSSCMGVQTKWSAKMMTSLMHIGNAEAEFVHEHVHLEQLTRDGLKD